FSFNAALNIYKQDSTFVNTKTSFKIPYLLNERHAIGLSFQTESSSNLLENISGSDILDFSTVFYGVNYNYQVSNQNTLFPIKLKINTELLTGGRKIDGNFNQQSRIYLKSHYLWSLNLKNHFFIQNTSSTLLSDNFLINELFRIGGVNSIRGFNEESILASSYSFFTLEYRFSPNNSSYLYSITDLGYLDNRNINKSSQIYSLGLGYAFRTKLGLLNLSYAIGKLSDQQFDLNNSKFHIKVISFF
ncbi:MAG: BamA/TamA family outer membrane protein, partial [Aureibaculum sp.]|nr:BamA/TamA family outer membrane protein [Aureibaculum sp.]